MKVTPTVHMLLLLKSMNYTYWFALGEFIDNSITSYVSYVRQNPDDERFNKLVIEIDWQKAGGYFKITDNAAGITNDDAGWGRALQLGKPNPNPEHIGVFGYGMKAAAFWMGSKLTISSKRIDETERRSVEMDVVEIERTGDENLPIIVQGGEDPNEHGTELMVSNLWNGREFPRANTVARISSFLTSMYRHYLRGDNGLVHPKTKQPFLVLKVRGVELKAEEFSLLESPRWDALKVPPPVGSPVVYWKKKFSIEVTNNRPRTKSNRGKPFVAKGWVGILKTMSYEHSGLFLSFHGKGIAGVGQSTKDGYSQDTYKPSFFGASNGARSRRLVGEIDMTSFGKLNTSDGVEISDIEKAEFEEKLLEFLKAEGIYQTATNYSAQTLEQLSPKETKQLQTTAENNIQRATELAQSVHAGLGRERVPSTVSKSAIKQHEGQNFTTASGIEVSFVPDYFGLDFDWLDIVEIGPLQRQIRLNMSHPFMQRYFTIPEQDPDPAFVLGIALAVCEIDNPDLYEVRDFINEWVAQAYEPQKAEMYSDR